MPKFFMIIVLNFIFMVVVEGVCSFVAPNWKIQVAYLLGGLFLGTSYWIYNLDIAYALSTLKELTKNESDKQ